MHRSSGGPGFCPPPPRFSEVVSMDPAFDNSHQGPARGSFSTIWMDPNPFQNFWIRAWFACLFVAQSCSIEKFFSYPTADSISIERQAMGLIYLKRKRLY